VDGSGQRLVLMSVTQSVMDVMSLCATVVFIELDEAGQKVAETQHRWADALLFAFAPFFEIVLEEGLMKTPPHACVYLPLFRVALLLCRVSVS